MKRNAILIALFGLLALGFGPAVSADAPKGPFVRLADLDVNSAQLDAFRKLAAEHVSAATRKEPGILAFHVVEELNQPGRIHVFEMYVDEAAYVEHLKSAHFKAFAAATADMLSSRELFDATAVRLGTKGEVPSDPVVRIAKLDIDPSSLSAYVTAVTEEIDDSIRLEPGVAAIYSVALKASPHQLRFFEIYANDDAYQKHIASVHFRKYVETTKQMITSRTLVETRPLSLYMKR